MPNLLEPSYVEMQLLTATNLSDKTKVNINPFSVFSPKKASQEPLQKKSYSDKLQTVFDSMYGVIDDEEKEKIVGIFDYLTFGIPRLIRYRAGTIISVVVNDEDDDEDDHCLKHFKVSEIPCYLAGTVVVIAATAVTAGTDVIPRFVLSATLALLAAPVVAVGHFLDSQDDAEKTLSNSR